MKIAHVSPYDHQVAGGVREHVVNLDRQFRALGHEVTIIAPASRRAGLAANVVCISDRVVPVPGSGSIARISLDPRVYGRIRRVLDKIGLEKSARSSKGEALFRGSLAQMGVIDLLQSLDMSRKTCALTLTLEDGDRCDIYFADGQISHAVYGGMVGDQAVYKALAWEEPKGSFQMDFAARPPERTTTSRSTQSLLMEGLRLLDEANRDNS
jgi:hypothetical protein